MNPWQLAQQLKHELGEATWPEGLGEVVFGPASVIVHAGGPIDESAHPPRFPFVLITIGSGVPDGDDPELLEQSFELVVAAEVAGDDLGELAVIGGSRRDYGTSTGAGVAEVAARVRATVGSLTAYDGAAIIVSASGTGGGGSIGQGKHLAFDGFDVRALCTDSPSYRAPEQFKVVGDTWSWAGEWCARRFDFSFFRIGYVSGSTPSLDVTLADLDAVIYDGEGQQVSYPPVAGRVYYLFAVYDSHGGSRVTGSSIAVGSYLAI